MKIREIVKSLCDRLTKAGYSEGEAKGVSQIVLGHLKGWSPSAIILNYDSEIDPLFVDGVDKIMDRVTAGEPVQYVLGSARFYGMDFKVNKNVLIPRPETEELVDIIIRQNPESDLKMLDVGTGSGCIAIALARNLRFPDVYAIDISQDALAVAIENSRIFKTKIHFEEDDIFHYTPLADFFDIIVSNPPYICEKEKSGMEPLVLDNEPHGALFVPDDDPLIFYRRIAMTGISALVPGGRLYFEINPLYADELATMLKGMGYEEVSLVNDMDQKPRFAIARKPNDPDRK